MARFKYGPHHHRVYYPGCKVTRSRRLKRLAYQLDKSLEELETLVPESVDLRQPPWHCDNCRCGIYVHPSFAPTFYSRGQTQWTRAYQAFLNRRAALYGQNRSQG